MEANPYKRARLELQLTQKGLAEQPEVAVTPQVILRVEQGLFSAPPPALTNFLSQHYYFKAFNLDEDATARKLSPAELTREYYTWVYELRKFNGRTSQPAHYARAYFKFWNPVTGIRIAWSEFRKNILGLSVAATAKLLVLQISLIQDLEKTGRNAAQVQDILLEWGIPSEAINYIPARVVKRNNLDQLI